MLLFCCFTHNAPKNLCLYLEHFILVLIKYEYELLLLETRSHCRKHFLQQHPSLIYRFFIVLTPYCATKTFTYFTDLRALVGLSLYLFLCFSSSVQFGDWPLMLWFLQILLFKFHWLQVILPLPIQHSPSTTNNKVLTLNVITC